MRIPLAHYPGMNRFVLDWLAGDTRATQFLPRPPSPAPRERDSAPRAQGEGLTNALIESNRRFGLFVENEIAAWSRGETVTLIAGQQVGFAGGPLYTLAKIATLVKMKRDLEKQGTPATVFFWLATEDHDFDEASTLNVPLSTVPHDKAVNRQLDLLCMRAIRATDVHAVVGSQPVPSPLVTQLLSLYDLERPQWLREGITFRDSFAELIATTFGNEVILVDSLLPELRRAGAPLFAQIEARWDDIQRALSNRHQQLSAAGYSEQVAARDGEAYTLLFAIDGDGRRIATSALPDDPTRISTSALTRPLLQDFVLRPDVFVGGPAEVAYYAQISSLHAMLNIDMPRVALRGHVLVAPQRLLRAFDRYDLAPESIFASVDALLAAREPENVARIRALAEEGKKEFLQKIEQIGELALPADHSLSGSIHRSIGHLEYHFHKLAERAIKGVVRKDRERYAAVRELVATLYPDRHVQDRVVSWFAYWCRNGDALLERVIAEVEPDSDHFRIVGI